MKIPEMMEHYKQTGRLRCRFITEELRNSDELLQIPELNSGFDTVYWYRGSLLTTINSDEHGYYVEAKDNIEAKDAIEGLLPLIFKVDVEHEGNYKVTVELYADSTIEDAMIFLGRRRLVYRGRIEGESYFKKTFITNVCPIIPRGRTTAMEDQSIDITIIGRGLRLSAVDVVKCNCRTIYIAGDSTVTDQSAAYPYYPGSSYCGWGQMLSAYLEDKVAVSNHAHSGLTTESFRSEGHYQLLYDRIKEDDICLIQFGHNDQKLMELKAFEGYWSRMVTYIEELRRKKAIPVIVTPLARNSWRGNDNTYNDLLEEYDLACKKLGEEYKVMVIDLHKKSMELIIKEGKEGAKRYFYPSDYTHSNDYGAFLFAGYIYEELVKNKELVKIEELELKAGNIGKDSWIPPMKIELPTLPEELSYIQDPGREELFADLEGLEDILTRVEALDFVIKTMHFFPTNVYNDIFTDVIGHETYAGTVECACQNGIIPDEMIVEGRLEPHSEITEKEFGKLAWNGYRSRRNISENEFITLVGEILEDRPITRGKAAKICRSLRI